MSLHCLTSQETLALHSSPAEPAAACSPSDTCYSSDAAAAVISHHSTRMYTEVSVNKRETVQVGDVMQIDQLLPLH